MGAILGGYIGSFLMAGAYLAIASFTSSMTSDQVISFILSVTICLILIMAGWPPVTQFVSGIVNTELVSGLLARLHTSSYAMVDFIASFGVMTHFDSFQRGVVDTRDILFFVSIIAFSLFGTAVILKGLRA